MGIFLGNLQLNDIVEKKYLNKIQLFLEENGYQRTTKCDDVEKKEGNYHIYDIPRLIHICGEKKVEQFIKFLKTEKLIGEAFIGQVGVGAVDCNPS